MNELIKVKREIGDIAAKIRQHERTRDAFNEGLMSKKDVRGETNRVFNAINQIAVLSPQLYQLFCKRADLLSQSEISPDQLWADFWA